MKTTMLTACLRDREEHPKDKREAIRLRNRRAIVAAAGELAAEAKSERVGVNELAARAGVSRRTIFNHFPSAEDAVFEYLSELVSSLITQVLDELPPPSEEGVPLGEVYGQLRKVLQGWSLIDALQPMLGLDMQETPAASLWGYRVTQGAVVRLEDALLARLGGGYTAFQVHIMATTLINSFAGVMDEWMALTGGLVDDHGRAVWHELVTVSMDLLGRGFDS